GGTGLGLSICKQLIGMMGGEIGVDSTPDEGSRFWFELPIIASAVAIEPNEAHRDWRVLLIASSTRALDIDVEQVRALGMEAIPARNPNQAWAWLESSAPAPPDLILLDMPESDKASNDFIDRLNGDTRFNRIPLIVYAINAIEPTAQLRFAGAKPCHPLQLRRIIERPSLSATPGATVIEMMQPLDILVAEDNLVNIAVLESMLKQLGHRATFCENGEVVLAAFCRAPRRFDVLLMDCEMPVLDGFDATRAIRAFEQQQQLPPIPIIALTAHAFIEQQQACLECGMDRYLSKPISMATLTGALQQYGRAARKSTG